MSSFIDEGSQKEKSGNFQFIEKLKSIVHQELSKNMIIFTITHQNSKFHYYTHLKPYKIPCIQLYWQIDFLPNLIKIHVTYSTYRTLGIPIIINDLRTKLEVNYSLKLINKNVPGFMTYMLNEKNQICISFQRSVFHESDRVFLMKSLKSIIGQTLLSAREEFQTLIPFLTIPIENYMRSGKPDKITDRVEEFNLIKLKNCFDRFRKNRQKTTQLVYEEKDIIKTRKKIQECTKLFGIELRCLDSLKYTSKEIQTGKILQMINIKNQNEKTKKVDKIAYQFQIIKVQQSQKKYQVNANSEIYFGKYCFRIFKTLIQDDKLTKSQNQKKSGPIFQQKDVIQERNSCLVKKKAMSKLSEKALRNETSFLKFIRNQVCLYIANYYLPLDNSWNELYIEQYESTLLDLIGSKEIKSFTVRLQIMRKILSGLKFMADLNICHRDIKPSNIMINKQNNPKIIDFGSTISVYNQKVIMSFNDSLCGTQGYFFPYEKCEESVKKLFVKKEYESHPLFDIYSYGVIVEKIFEEELSQKFNIDSVKDTLRYIVSRCKEQNPDNRLSHDEIFCLLTVLQRSLSTQQKKQNSVVL